MIRLAVVSMILAASLLTEVALTAAETLRVMSFNVRFGEANDGENHWRHRKELLVDVIRDFAPDLLGVQESLQFQSDYLASQIEGYRYFGRSRMNTPNEHCGIFYKADRFVQLAGGHLWLSESPQVPESKSWDSSLPRMATWLLLHDNDRPDGKPVLMINTHFDHRGQVARLRSAELLSKKIGQLRQLADEPLVIVTGDFNTGESTEPYEALVETDPSLRDSFRAAHPERGNEEGTFNSWRGETDGRRIDWILVGGGARVRSAEIIRTSRDGRYPSDHYPVTAILEPSGTDDDTSGAP